MGHGALFPFLHQHTALLHGTFLYLLQLVVRTLVAAYLSEFHWTALPSLKFGTTHIISPHHPAPYPSVLTPALHGAGWSTALPDIAEPACALPGVPSLRVHLHSLHLSEVTAGVWTIGGWYGAAQRFLGRQLCDRLCYAAEGERFPCRCVSDFP